MKIAVWHNLPSGGGKRALYYHVKGLLDRGHKVESWCPQTADQSYMMSLKDIVTEHVVPLEWRSLPTSNPLAVPGVFLKRMRAMEDHCKKCAEQINSGGFDILFANSCAFYRAAPIGRYVEMPKVLYLQEPYRWLYEALPQLPWVALESPRSFKEFLSFAPAFLKDLGKVQLLRRQMREEIKNAGAFDRILVNSLFSRESVLRAYGLDSKVCYLGVDADFFRPTGVKKEKFIVGMGGIYLGKGVERAITAVACIPKGKRPEIVWLGNFSDEKYQKEMEKLAQDLDVKIVFKVQPPQEEILGTLNRASLMIYTSLLEPLGLAPLEANACGTPVVAIAEGGVRETIKDGVNGFLAPDYDPELLGQLILRTTEDAELLERMSRKCRDYVLNGWTWQAAAGRLEENLVKAVNNLK